MLYYIFIIITNNNSIANKYTQNIYFLKFLYYSPDMGARGFTKKSLSQLRERD
jgi:hypothetical protein